MKISLFYEFPLPRPWNDDDERKLFQDGLDEVEAADKAGFSTVWLTEHHFLEEYCHSTAPEIFLAAASQRTKNIRLGFGIMHLPPAVNHPARVAERIATLDLISNGRVEFNTLGACLGELTVAAGPSTAGFAGTAGATSSRSPRAASAPSSSLATPTAIATTIGTSSLCHDSHTPKKKPKTSR